MEDYKGNAEKNLLELVKLEETSNRKLLRLEIVIGTTCTIAFLCLIYAAELAVTSKFWNILMIVVGFMMLTVGVVTCLKIEQDAGYYECPSCGFRYVPTMKAVVLAPHICRRRKMKCPQCEKRGYHKKVLTR